MSLRLAEAFLRATAHEGHQIRDLASLRAHMSGEHGLGVAGMLPQKVLLNLHEKDHTGTDWHGSPDASRSPGFTASRGGGMRRQAEAPVTPWERGRPSLEANGLTSDDTHPAHIRTEMGHHITTWHNPISDEWRMGIFHDSDENDDRTISVRLGRQDEGVGDRAMAVLRHPKVLRSMQDQMRPGAEQDGTWPRKFG